MPYVFSFPGCKGYITAKFVFYSLTLFTLVFKSAILITLLMLTFCSANSQSSQYFHNTENKVYVYIYIFDFVGQMLHI